MEELTKREREVPALMAERRSNRRIASELLVTVAAVVHHISSIFAKFNVPVAPMTVDGWSRYYAYLGRSSDLVCE